MKSLLYFISSMSIITSCQNPATVKAAIVSETKLNVSYGNDSAQRMDIYLPANRSILKTASLILIHGGGWNSGSKSSFSLYIDSLKNRLPDYAFFNIDYRLLTSNHIFPSQENDIKAAVDFIVRNAETYQVNKSKFVLLGASAGAHLALLQAYKYDTPKIKAVIDFFGPTDLTSMYNYPWHSMIPQLLQVLTGTTPSANSNIYKNSSPVNFINSQTPPTLILHGAKDQIVDPSQSRLLKEKLQKSGVVNEMIVYPKEAHGWYGADLTDSFNRIIIFLQTHI